MVQQTDLVRRDYHGVLALVSRAAHRPELLGACARPSVLHRHRAIGGAYRLPNWCHPLQMGGHWALPAWNVQDVSSVFYN